MMERAEAEKWLVDTFGNHPEAAEQQGALSKNPVAGEDERGSSGEDRIPASSMAMDQTAEEQSILSVLGLTPSGCLVQRAGLVQEDLLSHLKRLLNHLLQRGSPEEASRIMHTEHTQRDPTHPLASVILTVHHYLIYNEAGNEMVNTDLQRALYLYRESADLARKAAAIVPDSIALAFIHFLALVAARAAPKKISKVCKAALTMKNPTGFLWPERLGLVENKTPQGRVQFIRLLFESFWGREPAQVVEQAEAPGTGIISRQVQRNRQHRRSKAITHWKVTMDAAKKEEFFRIQTDSLFSCIHADEREEVRKILEFVRAHGVCRGWVCPLCLVYTRLTEEFSSLAHMELCHGQFRSIQKWLSDLSLLQVDLSYADVVKEDFEKGLNASIDLLGKKGENFGTMQVTQERDKVVKEIQTMLCRLIQNKRLCKGYLDIVLNFAEEEFRGLFPGEDSLGSITTQPESSLQRICFLGTSQLNMIQSFLKELVDQYLSSVTEHPSSEQAKQLPISFVQPRTVEDHPYYGQAKQPAISFHPDSSCLLLNKSHFASDGDETVADSLMWWLYPDQDDEIIAKFVAWKKQKQRSLESGCRSLWHLRSQVYGLCQAHNFELACRKELPVTKNGWTLQDYTSKDDTATRLNQIIKADADFMKKCAVVQQWVKRLAEECTIDFNVILVALIKSYLERAMDELVEKDTKCKADLPTVESPIEDHAKGKKEKKKKKKKASKSGKAKDKKDLMNDRNISTETSMEVPPTSAETSTMMHAPVHADHYVEERRLENESEQSHLEKKEKMTSELGLPHDAEKQYTELVKEIGTAPCEQDHAETLAETDNSKNATAIDATERPAGENANESSTAVDVTAHVISDSQLSGGNTMETSINESQKHTTIIKSLWHLERFRYIFSDPKMIIHQHVGEPCHICALHEVFCSLDKATTIESQRGADLIYELNLSRFISEKLLLQEHTAAQVLEVLFDCLYHSFTPSSRTETEVPSNISEIEAQDNTGSDHWVSLAGALSGMNMYEKVNCINCGNDSKLLVCTSVFFDDSALPTQPVQFLCTNIEELLEKGLLSCCKRCESDCMNTYHTDSGVLYFGEILTPLELNNDDPSPNRADARLLVSMICFDGNRYHCMGFSRKHRGWVRHHGATLQVIGCGHDMLNKLKSEKLLPWVLLFED